MKSRWFIFGLALLICTAAAAQFSYVTNDGIAIINGYTGGGGAVVIPSTLGGLPVTVVESSGFENKGITSVAIPDTVTNIQAQEFAPNDFLTAITLDSNNPVYSSAGGVLFDKSGKTLLEYPSGNTGTYAIPTNVTAIGQNAFAACYYLAGVTIPDSVTNIGATGFGYCFALTNITIPASVTGIEPDAFINCANLPAITVASGNLSYKSVAGVLFDKDGTTLMEFPTALGGVYAIPSGVTTIGTNAFVLCDNLAGVMIPASVTTVADGAFADCAGLTNVTLGAGVDDLATTAFAGCNQLLAINVNPLNQTLSSIGGVIFSKDHTTLLQFPPGFQGAYTVPNSVTRIADYAFQGCQLTDVTIPGNVIDIGMFSFQGCGSLTNVTMSNGVESIGEFAFGDSPKLATVTIPATVTALPFGAFAYDGLTMVHFLGNAPSVDSQAFLGDASATIYYSPGTSGWETTLDGLTTALENAPSPNGALQVTLWPAGASASGAQWSVDGGFLQPSGAVVQGLSVGQHALSFTSAPGWTTPSNEMVSISANATNMASGLYAQLAAPSTNFTFVTNEGTITITGYTGAGGAVEIPAVIDGLPVTTLGQSAFSDNSLLTAVTIPDSVTNFGYFVFSACYGLESVTIPTNVNTISLAMFQDCTSLNSVIFRGPIVNFADDAFASCTQLGNLVIPDTVTNIGQYAFFGGALTNVTIPAATRNVGTAAFLNCSALPAINVDPANTNYSSVDGVLFDKRQTVLLQYPNGKGGANYTVSNGVTAIGDSAFEYSTLTNVTIPSSVTSIGNYSFESCGSLAAVNLSQGLTSIGNNAFAFCGALTQAAIPASVTSIGWVPFVDCNSMTAINVAASNPIYGSANGVMYNKSGTMLVEFPGGVGGNFAVPPTVQDIGSQAFENSLITGLAIPASVTNVESYAFSGCGALGSVTMANSVTSIGVAAFQNASSLSNLTLSTTLTNIGYSAFSDCGALRYIVIPQSVSVMADYAFAYCPALATAYFLGKPLPDDGTIFFNDPATTVFYRANAPGWAATFGTATTAPAAQLSGLAAAGGNIVLDVIGGQTTRSYIVVASDNLNTPTTSWTPVATNMPTANGNFSITILQASGANRFYSILTE